MFKSRLQEYCQSKKWNLPEYSTTKEGLHHCPLFKACVIVNGVIFATPNPCKSSKEAQNLVAQIAYQHLIGPSSANTSVQVPPAWVGAQQPKINEPLALQAASLSGVNLLNRNDKKVTADIAHLYKNQLQIYAQKRNLNLPVYISEREGPPHACLFRSKVMLQGKTYESLEYFNTIKDAENAAAKVALKPLMSVSSNDGIEEEDPGFSKNLLQELAQKEYSCLPAYVTTRSGPSHDPVFSSTVKTNEYSFTGQKAKTKKLAEMNAAKVAYNALRLCTLKQNSGPDWPGFHVNDAPHSSSPKLRLLSKAELTDTNNSVPSPISNSVPAGVSCNKGTLDDLQTFQPPRVRSFPHVDGNYAVHVYIPVHIPQPARKEASQFLKKVSSNVPGLHVVDADIPLGNLLNDYQKLENIALGREFHISLGRTVPIRVHQIDSMVNMLRQKLQLQKRYWIDFNKWEVFVNDDHTRTFLSIEVLTGGLSEITKQIQAVNEVYRLHNLPEFYKDPRPHISLAWALGDADDLLRRVVEETKKHLETGSSLQKPVFTVKFSGIECKIGHKTYKICKMQDE